MTTNIQFTLFLLQHVHAGVRYPQHGQSDSQHHILTGKGTQPRNRRRPDTRPTLQRGRVGTVSEIFFLPCFDKFVRFVQSIWFVAWDTSWSHGNCRYGQGWIWCLKKQLHMSSVRYFTTTTTMGGTTTTFKTTTTPTFSSQTSYRRASSPSPHSSLRTLAKQASRLCRRSLGVTKMHRFGRYFFSNHTLFDVLANQPLFYDLILCSHHQSHEYTTRLKIWPNHHQNILFTVCKP